eukprot:9485513-Pyramimonas_sp.AAC.2
MRERGVRLTPVNYNRVLSASAAAAAAAGGGRAEREAGAARGLALMGAMKAAGVRPLSMCVMWESSLAPSEKRDSFREGLEMWFAPPRCALEYLEYP